MLDIHEKVVVGVLDLVAKGEVVDPEHGVGRKADGIWVQDLGVDTHLIEELQAGTDLVRRGIDLLERLNGLRAEYLLHSGPDGIAAHTRPNLVAEIPRADAPIGPHAGHAASLRGCYP